jgi:hypothetical protein
MDQRVDHSQDKEHFHRKLDVAATMAVTLVMLHAIRDHYLRTGQMIAMKPAGGIRTSKQALHYLMMVKEELGPEWLSNHWFRFGASSLANLPAGGRRHPHAVAEGGRWPLPERGLFQHRLDHFPATAFR